MLESGMGSDSMSKLTEEDVKYRFISPAIEKAGWDKEQVALEHYFTAGQMVVRGKTAKRRKGKKADYILTQKSGRTPLAIIEAKDEDHSLGAGMQQAMEYAQILNVPFAYSSNGKGFLEHDFFTGKEKEISLDEFPTEEELWKRYLQGESIEEDKGYIVKEPDHFDYITKLRPRYYQRVAIQKTLEAVAKNQKRILLVMATGTGKTFTAFQIIWKLREAGIAKKVLFLADRNVLVDQTMSDDFKPFQKFMTKIQEKKLDSAFEVYMSLYNQLAGDDGEEAFLKFKPEFFDLIVVDEAHRGSAKEDSQWRKILEYFSPAIQLGMTATPKETKYVSNINYFGEPVYNYSLKRGIEDGFLAPYKVIRISIDKDLEGWRPYLGQMDDEGNVIEDREYNIKDFDRRLVIDERTKTVAKRITEWLHTNGRFSKTIVFCVDIDHAERMRQALSNENSDLVKENPKYIMRITGDNPEGKAQLDNFQDVHEVYPTIVTTSKLMTTGVNTKTTKLIVLDSNINSMTEFKQIIGRGTRLYPEHGKSYFTILDFRGVSRLFADPDFDGDPAFIYEPKEDEVDWTVREEDGIYDILDDEPHDHPEESRDNRKYRIRGLDVSIVNERVQYYDIDGKLITESIKDYSKRNILGEFATMDEFLHYWTNSERKEKIIEELQEHGVLLEALREESGKDIDDFDLILHVAYDKKPLTKKERVERVKKKGYLYKYSDVCQEVLSVLLEKYMDGSVVELESTKTLQNAPFDKLGSPKSIAKLFGGRTGYLNAVKELQNEIYNVTT